MSQKMLSTVKATNRLPGDIEVLDHKRPHTTFLTTVGESHISDLENVSVV